MHVSLKGYDNIPDYAEKFPNWYLTLLKLFNEESEKWM